VAVAMVTVMAVMAMVTMMVVMVVLVEQITDETSDETSDERQTEHSAFSLSARGARACFMPTLGCLQTSPSSHKPIGPSVMCRTLRPVRHSFAASPAAARARKALKCSVFQRNGDVIAGAIA
jgi:hypothetical protein